jgi:hypothetical protein
MKLINLSMTIGALILASHLGMSQTSTGDKIVDAAATRPASTPAYTVAFVPICDAKNTDSEKQFMASFAKQITKAFRDSSVQVIDFDTVAKAAATQKVEGFVMLHTDDILAGGITASRTPGKVEYDQFGHMKAIGMASLHDSSKTAFGSELVAIASALPPACNIIIYFGPCRADAGHAQMIQVYITDKKQVLDAKAGRWWQLLEVLNTSIEAPNFSDNEIRKVKSTMRSFTTE